jgi:hypothetical protein
VGSPECFTKYDYIDTMIVQTIAPLCIVTVVFFAYGTQLARMRLTRASDEKISRMTTKYVTFFFLITYLVLPSVTTTIFGAFVCENIDPDNLKPGTPTFLRNDLSIPCTGPDSLRYKFGVIWAVIMILVYPIGVLSIYFYTLYFNRKAIIVKDMDEVEIDEIKERDEKNRRKYREAHGGSDEGFVSELYEPVKKGVMKYITMEELSFLHKAYEGRCWYWEIVETCRRLLLTAVVSVVDTGSAAQIVFSIFIAVIYIKLYGFYAPYDRVRWNGNNTPPNYLNHSHSADRFQIPKNHI